MQPVRQHLQAVFHIKLGLGLLEIQPEIVDIRLPGFVVRLIEVNIGRSEGPAPLDEEGKQRIDVIGVPGGELLLHIGAPQLPCGIRAMHRQLQRIHVQIAFLDLVDQGLHLVCQHFLIPVVDQSLRAFRAQIVDRVALVDRGPVCFAGTVLPEGEQIPVACFRSGPGDRMAFALLLYQIRDVLQRRHVKL